MKNVILFRFYKEPDICVNRLEILRKYNPKTKIFGLYGWPQKDEKIYKKALWQFLEDFYISPYTDSEWKRKNGDLVIADRYKKRGNTLDWDSIYVVQRDMVIFTSLKKLFSDYKKDQFYIPGTRVLDKNIESKRHRTSKITQKPIYEKFKQLIKQKYWYTKKLLCSLPTFSIFPRIFLEKYNKLEDNVTWFLEYKMPTYAKIFKLELYKKDTGMQRFQKEGKCPQNAIPREISQKYINKELKKEKWRRMFHPYFKIWDQNENNQ